MAEEKPRSRTRKRSTAKAPTEESKAQAEFARYKARVEGASDETSVPSFATPLPRGAVPAWSLQPPMYATAPAGGGPPDWGSPSPGAAGSQTVVEGAGQAIRLGVDLVNAALSRSVQMLNGLGDTVGMVAWGERSGCGCGSCCDCCDPCGYDCCYVMGCGCGRCEPSVGSCC